MSIVFFGTSQFAVPILGKLVASGFRPALVVTTPDVAQGKKQEVAPSPVKVKAEEFGLKVYQPVNLKSQEALGTIRVVKPAVGVLAAYGKIIPKEIISLFPKGILNVHPSLLPRWRGPTPVQAAILAGDEKTGVTVILIDEEVDHGPILGKSEILIFQPLLDRQTGETYESLHGKLAQLGAELLAKTLPKWLDDELLPAPQAHTKATFCKKYTREDARIDWSKSAEEIDRTVRALNPEPGTWTTIEDPPRVLKVVTAIPPLNSQGLEHHEIGRVLAVGKKVVVQCGDGALVLERVQPEGKRPMPGADFLRGHGDVTRLE